MTTPISAEPSYRNAKDTIASGRVTKNPKACEECRRKKQKCDGQTPCGMCTKRRSQCSYRTYIRQRGARTSPRTQDEVATPNENDSASGGTPQLMPPRVHIFNNIRTTQDTTRRRTELFYGASSPFSVLQHLDTHLLTQGSPAAHSDTSNEEVQDGGESIKSYNYQNIVFGHLPNPPQDFDDVLIASHASAKVALRNFLLTACPRLPFLNTRDLCTTFEKLYDQGTDVALDPSDRALIVIALALGALPIADLPHRQHFFAQARAEVQSMVYNINFKTVQATLMMAQFEYEAGSPNVCYLHLGNAIRKAFASGLHRVDTPEAKQTMWVLYCNESLLCFKFGRRSGLTEEDITMPTQGEQSHLSYFVRLCTIVRSACQIYQRDNSVAADLNCAKSVHQQLREFATMLKANAGIEIGGQIYTLSGETLAWHIAMSYAYYVTKLLLYRPFLLLSLELKRRGIGDTTGVRNGGVVTAELVEAAETCMRSAQILVELCEDLFSLHIGIEGVYNHAFYLESACFVLGLAAVHDSGRNSTNYLLERASIGLQLLRRLGPREPAQSVSAAVEQMISRIRALPTRMSEHHANAPQAAGHSRPHTATVNQPIQLSDVLLTDAAPTSAHDSSASFGFETEILDDLWTMMDWNVGFPDLDPMTSILSTGLR